MGIESYKKVYSSLTNDNVPTLSVDQLNNIFSFSEQIIGQLDDYAIDELYSGSGGDIDKLFDIILQETNLAIHGKTKGLKTSSFGYLDKLTESLDEVVKKISYNYFVSSCMPDFEIALHHIEWGNLIQMYSKLAVIAARDHCFGRDTVVRMFDGSLKKIQDIVKGDEVMGPDSTKRKVLSTHSGVDSMYKVDQARNNSYVIKRGHPLCLKHNNRIVDVVLNLDNCNGKEFKGVSIKDKGISDSYNIRVSPMGQGEYFGFECDRDHRFLLEDGTVVHNSKSFTFSYAYPIWKMFRYQRPNVLSSNKTGFELSQKGMIVTNEHSLGKELLGIIKEGIENNDYLKENLMPINRNDGTWGKEELTCKNGANLKLKSYGSKMRGFHPGYIILDDFLNDQVIYSLEQKEKYWTIFKGVVDNMLLPNGQLIVVGTPFVQGDLYDKLKEDEDFKVFEYPSIWPDGRVLWPERYDLDALLRKRKSQGSVVFSREHLVTPISDQSSLFPYDIIEKAYKGMDKFKFVKNIHSFPKRFERVVVGTDFALSSNVGADYTVFTVIGKSGIDFWLLYMYREKGVSFNTQMSVLKQINRNFRPSHFVIETNGAQKIFAQQCIESGLPVLEHHTGEDKYSTIQGLPAMAILFEQERFKIPRGDQLTIDKTDILASELHGFTYDTEKAKIVSVTEHDDTAMSIWQGIRGCVFNGDNFDFSFV